MVDENALPPACAAVRNSLALREKMKPLVNLEERIGKTVGRRSAPSGLPDTTTCTPADARDWQRAFRTPGIPRGVHRFASHEEADAWLMKMITGVRRS
jgi:hypothetical protein